MLSATFAGEPVPYNYRMSSPEYFEGPLEPGVIQRLADDEFGDMVKFVVDIRREVICVGGGFHSDEEAVLLEKGSAQSDLWGANFYPGRPAGQKLVYTSMINIRPSDGNLKQEISLPDVRERVLELTKHFFGSC